MSQIPVNQKSECQRSVLSWKVPLNVVVEKKFTVNDNSPQPWGLYWLLCMWFLYYQLTFLSSGLLRSVEYNMCPRKRYTDKRSVVLHLSQKSGELRLWPKQRTNPSTLHGLTTLNTWIRRSSDRQKRERTNRVTTGILPRTPVRDLCTPSRLSVVDDGLYRHSGNIW